MLLKSTLWKDTIQKVKQLISKTQGKSLFLFDIDDVLLKITGLGSSEWFYQHLQEYPLEVLENAYTLFLLENPATVTDPLVVDFIREIQKEKHQTVALTARSSKQLTSTLRDLQQAGIQLDATAFPDTPTETPHQVFSHNVYFAAGKNKGEIAHVLARDYQNVFFFDDDLKNAERVHHWIPSAYVFHLTGYKTQQTLSTSEEDLTEELIQIIKKLKIHNKPHIQHK